jgi:hypothetical protein
MQYSFRLSRALLILGVFALLSLSACGGGGGKKGGGGTTGGSSNPFSPTDLSGDWTGTLTPRDNEGLPWSNGERRILSRNFTLRADGLGNIYYCLPGLEDDYDVRGGGATLSQSSINKKGLFTLSFKEKEKNREQLVLVCRLNDARNLITGEYELRSRTENTSGDEVEAVDAGGFELVLSNGPGSFSESSLEGHWEGSNYHYAPRYANMLMDVDANGSITGGGVDTGVAVFPFLLDGSNDQVFALFEDSSVGMFENITLHLSDGVDVVLQYALLDEGGGFFTGPVTDHKGNTTYMRLTKK